MCVHTHRHMCAMGDSSATLGIARFPLSPVARGEAGSKDYGSGGQGVETKHREGGVDCSALTCLNGRMPPLIRRESAAMPAMPSVVLSRSCFSETFGTVWEWPQELCEPQQMAVVLDSGCELCRIIREPFVGDDVISTGGTCCCRWCCWWWCCCCC